MGKLLISGNGKDYVRSQSDQWIIVILFAVGFIVLGFVLANEFGYETVGGAIGGAIGGWIGVTPPQVRTIWYSIFLFGGVLVAALMIAYCVLLDVYAGKTEIEVYENGIKGAGGGPKFLISTEDTVSVSTFQLEYDRIASVDVSRKNILSINAYGRVYAVAVINPNEIADTINERLRQAKSAVK